MNISSRIRSATIGAFIAVFAAALSIEATGGEPASNQPAVAAPANSTPPAKVKGPSKHERAVGAALFWLAKHQSPDGRWSLVDYVKKCKDKTCSGAATEDSPVAATALGVLCFAAAGQNHLKEGPFKKTEYAALVQLVRHQADDGSLAGDDPHPQFSHALATLAISEAFGISNDKALMKPIEKAIGFIEQQQNAETGGWSDTSKKIDDTAMFGWQMLALSSATRTGFRLKTTTLPRAEKYLQAITVRDSDRQTTGEFLEKIGGKPQPLATAIGLSCEQILRLEQTSTVIAKSESRLIEHMPKPDNRHMITCFFATRALHNMGDDTWKTWNHDLVETLADNQSHEGCSSGSWEPDQSSHDGWGIDGGRLMTTCFACLSLETYYRYLAIYGATPTSVKALSK